MLLLHICIALASVGLTTYTFFSPSKSALFASYGLVAATIASGTILIVRNPAHMLEVCTMGLVYVAGVSVGLVFAHRKLAAETISSRSHKE
jgi:hypothetical protein